MTERYSLKTFQHALVFVVLSLGGCVTSSDVSEFTAEGIGCTDGIGTATGGGQGKISVRMMDGRWLNFESAGQFVHLVNNPQPIERAGFSDEPLPFVLDNEVPVEGTIELRDPNMQAIGVVTLDGRSVPFEVSHPALRPCNPPDP